MIRLFCTVICAVFFATTTVAQVQTAGQVLDQVGAQIDEKGALRMDAYMTEALRAARAEGPLTDPQWADVMMVNGVMILSGLARYQRGMTLLQDAETLATETGNHGLAEAILAFTTYYHAWFGSDALARATMARMQSNPLDILEADEAETLRLLLADPKTPGTSPGFTRITEIMRDSARVFSDGDYEQATSLLRGLRLPPPLDDDPLVRAANAIQSATLGTYTDIQNDPRAAGFYAQAFDDLLQAGSDPPALRPALLTDPVVRDLVASAVDILAQTEPEGTLKAATLKRWLDQVSEGLGNRDQLALEAAIRTARNAGDWERAAKLSQEMLDTFEHPRDVIVTLRANVQIYRARAATARGEPIDHDALSTAFVDVFDEDSVQIFGRASIASQILSTFEAAGHFHLANIVGIALHDWVQALSRRGGQSGEAISAQAGFWRAAGSRTVQTGFDVLLSPLDGSDGPPGVCQEILGIEVCTAVLQLD